jgi:CRISP-associated protein Cas1
MSYHILSIDTPDCSLSCKDGQVTCRSGPDTKTVPIEDVAAIIITSFSALVHSNLLLEAAKHGVALIICESFKPVSLVLPANRATDTLLTRAQVDLPTRSRETLWRRTVDAKCGNQLSLMQQLLPGHESLRGLEIIARGKHPQKEALCARVYWQMYGEALGIPDFTREREAGGVNALLNYGYAVLLSTMLQKLFGVGIDPTFGINHVVRERSTPLAYDLMEPFRPCVDWRVAQWVKGRSGILPDNGVAGFQPGDGAELTVTKDFRRWVTAFPLVEVEYLDLTLDVRGVIEGVVRCFRKALMENKPVLYKPWTQRNSKWAG